MLRVGEVAEQAGLSVETVRYYEKAGAITPPPRGANGYRVYSRVHAQQLAFIGSARRLGFSLKDVRSLLALAAADQPDQCGVKAIASRHLEEVRGRIANLTRIADALLTITEACPDTLGGTCPILDALLDPHCEARRPVSSPEPRKR